MSIIRTLLNNGFFVLSLLVAATLYLAYSDKIKEEHGILPIPSISTEPTVIEPLKVITTQTNSLSEEAATTRESQPAQMVPETTTKPEAAATLTLTQTSSAITETTSELETTSTEEATTVAAKTSPLNEDAIKILEPSTESLPPLDEAVLAQFKSAEEAIAAARQAFYDKDYLTAEKIYLPLAYQSQQADMVGELANVLWADDKKEWAQKAWLESAKLLVKEGRLNDAMILAQRLRPVAPAVAEEIAQNVTQLQQMQRVQQAAENQKAMLARAEKQERMAAQQKAYQEQMQTYQQQMQAYNERLKAYYAAQAKQSQQQNPQASAPQMPVMPNQQEQQARIQAHQQQMQAYNERLKAYHEAQRQQMNAPMQNGSQPFYPMQPR